MNPLKLTNGWIREFFLMLTFTGGFCGALIGESPGDSPSVRRIGLRRVVFALKQALRLEIAADRRVGRKRYLLPKSTTFRLL